MRRHLPWLFFVLLELCAGDGQILNWSESGTNACSWPRNLTLSLYLEKQDCFNACVSHGECKAVYMWENNGQVRPSCVLMSETCVPNASPCNADSWCGYNKPSVLWTMSGKNTCPWSNDIRDQLPEADFPAYLSASDCFESCNRTDLCKAVFIWQANGQAKPSCVYMSQPCDENSEVCSPDDWCAYNKPNTESQPASAGVQSAATLAIAPWILVLLVSLA